MTNTENERAAYMRADVTLADLFDRLEMLTESLGQAVAEIAGFNPDYLNEVSDEI